MTTPKQQSDKPADPTASGQKQTWYRRVITIRGEDSPNVRLGMAEERAGKTPSGRTLVPGILSYAEYKKRRKNWDVVRQSIGLDAKFWHGAEVLLYPPEWLISAELVADKLHGRMRIAKGMGVDPAEGGDRTCIAVTDELGLLELESCLTPDTQVIVGEVRRLIGKYNLDPESVCFDRGGGGYGLANQMRAMGLNVRTVDFGGSAKPHDDADQKSRRKSHLEKLELTEVKTTFKDQRAEMYYELRRLLDPSVNPNSFGLPSMYNELFRQLSLIPLRYDIKGKFYLLPKSRRSVPTGERTLIDIIGHSPDDADALVLAIHAMKEKPKKIRVGAIRNPSSSVNADMLRRRARWRRN
jgi:hypothetical protein